MQEPIVAGDRSGERAGEHLTAVPEMRDCLSQFGRRLTTMEISGSMGDLGTYIPIVVALSIQYGLSLRNTFVLSGISSIATGLMFDIPMAVQPMKSIAAVALAAETSEEFTIESMLAAGMITATFVMVLGLTGLIDAFNKRIPNPIVRGLQLGLGTLLVKKGVQLLNRDADWSRRFLGWDGYLLAGSCFIYALLFYRSRRVPVALVLFAFGLVVAIVRNSATEDTELTPTDDVANISLSETVTTCGGGANAPIQDFGIHWPTASDWATGFVHMAIPQIPLTTMNSVIAVCKLSDDLFPDMDDKHKATPRRVATSVGLMNILTCLLGGFPMCHGAGGLAGQYRFGGRTGASVEFLGVVKIVLGLAFGQRCLELLSSCAFPYAVLGVMLGVSGLELAMSAKDINGEVWEDAFLLFATATSTIAFSSTATGALVGAVTYASLLVAEKMVRLRFLSVWLAAWLVLVSIQATSNIVHRRCPQNQNALPEVVDATAAESGTGYREEAERGDLEEASGSKDSEAQPSVATRQA